MLDRFAIQASRVLKRINDTVTLTTIVVTHANEFVLKCAGTVVFRHAMLHAIQQQFSDENDAAGATVYAAFHSSSIHSCFML